MNFRTDFLQIQGGRAQRKLPLWEDLVEMFLKTRRSGVAPSPLSRKPALETPPRGVVRFLTGYGVLASGHEINGIFWSLFRSPSGNVSVDNRKPYCLLSACLGHLPSHIGGTDHELDHLELMLAVMHTLDKSRSRSSRSFTCRYAHLGQIPIWIIWILCLSLCTD